MKKIGHIFRRLAAEYSVMHKPARKELVKNSLKVTGTAACAAVVLKLVDTGFAALLSLIL